MWIGGGAFYGDGSLAGEHALELAGPLMLEAEVATETEFWIKQNDTLPAFLQQMQDRRGNPVNLTLCESVKFIMDTLDGGEKVNAAAVIEDAAGGWVRYDWAAGDTDTVDVFQGEFQATMADGNIVTAPTRGGYKIRVYEELGS